MSQYVPLISLSALSTRTGTNGTDSAPQNGLLILYSIHKLPRIYDGKGHTRAHRQLRTSGTDFMVQAPSNTPQKRTQHLQQNWQNKTRKAHQLQERLMTKYLDGLPQDTKPLRSCAVNRTTMIFKCQSRKVRGVQEEQQLAQITILRHFWHHMIQIALTTIHHDLLWPIREKL